MRNRKILLVVIILSILHLPILAQNDLQQYPKKPETFKYVPYSFSFYRISIDKLQVSQIKLSAFPVRFQPLNVLDSEHISIILNYLTSLTIGETYINHSLFYGGGYLIRVKFKSGTERVFNHSGNMFLIDENVVYKISYEEAIKMDQIVAGILEYDQETQKTPHILGSIVSINSDASGRKSFCTLRDNNDILHKINIKNASIIDATGTGWMILHENDNVKIYYQKNEQSDVNSLIASLIFIKKTLK